jgi:hypothetical protein
LGIGGAALVAPYLAKYLNPGADGGNATPPDYYSQFGTIGTGGPGGQFGGFTNPGLNPGFIQAGVARSEPGNQYYWGAHPYMRDFPDLANYNNVPLQNPMMAQGPVAPQPTPFNSSMNMKKPLRFSLE